VLADELAIIVTNILDCHFSTFLNPRSGQT
jgi:hypothetical protein